MAELPEIELLRQKLRRNILHKRVGVMQMQNAKGEALPDGAGIKDAALKGRAITDLHRYGQYLFLELDRKDILALQLGGELSGELERGPVHGEGGEEPRAALEIQINGQQRLRFQGTQLGNRLRMLDENSDVDFLTKLGPDPLMVHGEGLGILREALSRRRSALRNILLDDTFAPGIGGIWADEILFQARLRPDRTATSLSEEERERFLEQIPKVLDRAVRCQAKTNLLPKTFLTRHREDGHCPSCGGALETLSVGGKNAMLCPACQS
ncbi:MULTISPECIES: DNA-formamidopyrimidine glycosylase family protein [Acidithiobacillus]|jgi:formamidopyrimidine-DNA glycosylase|uniref:Formamidopyrimidine-DNA glycosylase, putative n=3 Tax=Pseudomonadota TaxID=1224 RepID=B7J4K6_ACIF2|nr:MULTISPECIES: DNA-formamidopyrimidine glycosylase family protein [Acidithiobacillus]MCL5956935.1 formamidopyrimidine-DNA glycosylase [Gammaproteobacteria bacterium]ACH82877.1 DNA glycosylase/AP lyase, H2TH DNA-binding [Acidithiobacillus ferrooxidans ATCC 53993]ACK80681.1 formamidopyrimidine-DNA glycosylase, putative [Acidithiobacillus ferrooxidans ATCC 23270]MBN6745433.1 formamidopyrimidine-DNA glycosylase [Acidithiobacillus sp. MC2.2]MBN6748327.1 formamidopyrimidine-DNA glycosylase [Acidit